MTVRTRFAPSPTGYLHVGGARTALFCWLYARHCGGEFVLRIEDTDRERSTPESVQAILDSMEWLGLDYDEGPFYQTRRFDRYTEVLDRLLAAGHAYRCYCTREELDTMRAEQQARDGKPRYDGRCRNRAAPRDGVDPVVRFRNPTEGRVVVDDRVRGKVEFSNEELDDLIIARSDGTPTYNFTVVVDDWDMRITHVIRGDDHLNNTPRQINILAALGADIPTYAHVPMILGRDGARLSKRHGAVSVLEYRDQGYLPEALLNYLVRLGWSHGDQEIFSRAQMIEKFDLPEINKSASAFDDDKLQWLNQQYIKTVPGERLGHLLVEQLRRLGVEAGPTPDPVAVAETQRDRAKTVCDMAQQGAFFYRSIAAYDAKAARKHLTAESGRVLRVVAERLAALEAWDTDSIHRSLHSLAESLQLQMGKVAQPIRVAVSGGPASPPIDETLRVLGRETTLARIAAAIDFIASNSGPEAA